MMQGLLEDRYADSDCLLNNVGSDPTPVVPVG